MPLKLESIAALRAGPEIDRLVHTVVLDLPDEGTRGYPCYSETTGAMTVLGIVPVEVGRYADNDPEFTRERPYYGRFTSGPIADPQTIVFTSATPELALCKIALAYRSVTGPQEDSK